MQWKQRWRSSQNTNLLLFCTRKERLSAIRILHFGNISKPSNGKSKVLRLTQSLPVLNELGKWITREIKQVLPKSKIGKAMAYCTKRWDALNAYLYDGILEIDNNLVENAIRPVALGRKNYLFAGSHQSAQRAAVIYSLLAICKKHDINPYQWLKYILENILSSNLKDVSRLFPQNFSKIYNHSDQSS